MSSRSRLLWAACAGWFAVAAHAAPNPSSEPVSADARYAASWVLAGADNRQSPFAVVDKRDARIYVFEPGGRLVGASPVLLGAAPGDFGVDMKGRTPASLAPAERTTPAGRFASTPGRNDKGEDIVWIDYAAALAIHRLRPAPVYERRPARLASATPADNRISSGCIVVPVAFFETVVAPTLGQRRGVVYVLPESRPAQALFAELDLGD